MKNKEDWRRTRALGQVMEQCEKELARDLETMLGSGQDLGTAAVYFQRIQKEYHQLNQRLRALVFTAGENDIGRFVEHELPVAEMRPYARMCALQKWMSRPKLPRLGFDRRAWACAPCPPPSCLKPDCDDLQHMTTVKTTWLASSLSSS